MHNVVGILVVPLGCLPKLIVFVKHTVIIGIWYKTGFSPYW
jgi:hypothetical protein